MNLFLLGFKIVYLSNPFFYIGVTMLVFLLLWISFNILDELLFFTPILYFYLPTDAIIGFILTIIISIMLGIVVAMNIYLIRHSNLRIGKSWISGSFLGVISSVCASCSSIGFLMISTFGGVGMYSYRVSHKLSDSVKNSINIFNDICFIHCVQENHQSL